MPENMEGYGSRFCSNADLPHSPECGMSEQKASTEAGNLLSPSDSLPALRVSGEGLRARLGQVCDSGKRAVRTGEAVCAASLGRSTARGLCAELVPGLVHHGASCGQDHTSG